MLPCLQKRLPAINVEGQKDTGGQFKQDPQMKLQPISLGAQNVETPGEGQIKKKLLIIIYSDSSMIYKS